MNPWHKQNNTAKQYIAVIAIGLIVITGYSLIVIRLFGL
jgi:hypothetical protein